MGILKKFTRFLKEGADAADSHDKLERVVEQEEEEEELISVNDESDGQIQENDVLLAFLSKLLRIRTSVRIIIHISLSHSNSQLEKMTERNEITTHILIFTIV